MRRFPDALTFLFVCLAAATILTYMLPAGEYDRRDDPVTSRKVVVARAAFPTPAPSLPSCCWSARG
jgi:uncharacterized ion transporter superfamily protein YfcC